MGENSKKVNTFDGKTKQESQKSVSELIDIITKNNVFKPVDDSNSTGLSPDLSDEDIDAIIKRNSKKNRE